MANDALLIETMLLYYATPNGSKNVCWTEYLIGVFAEITRLLTLAAIASFQTSLLSGIWFLWDYLLGFGNVYVPKETKLFHQCVSKQTRDKQTDRTKDPSGTKNKSYLKEWTSWNVSGDTAGRSVELTAAFASSPGLLEVPCSWWTMSIRPLFVPHSNLSKEKTLVCFPCYTKNKSTENQWSYSRPSFFGLPYSARCSNEKRASVWVSAQKARVLIIDTLTIHYFILSFSFGRQVGSEPCVPS